MRSAAKTVAAAAILGIAQAAGATVFFNDTFNGFNGGVFGTQADTGLTVGAFGNFDGWISGGANAMHAEDRTGTGDWAPMFYGSSGAGSPGSNSISLIDSVAANTFGTSYTVSFEGSAAAYANNSQANDPGDYLKFEVIDETFSTIASFLYDAPDWSFGPSNPFTAANFSYTGTGTGNVRLYIYAYTSFDHFGGAIDNITIQSNDDDDEGPVDAPEPAALALFGLGLAGIAAARS